MSATLETFSCPQKEHLEFTSRRLSAFLWMISRSVTIPDGYSALHFASYEQLTQISQNGVLVSKLSLARLTNLTLLGSVFPFHGS